MSGIKMEGPTPQSITPEGLIYIQKAKALAESYHEAILEADAMISACEAQTTTSEDPQEAERWKSESTIDRLKFDFNELYPSVFSYRYAKQEEENTIE
jgi:hypothetical protein